MKQALTIIAGNNLKKFEHWRNELLKILSHIEAKIDFPDEDLPENILKNIKDTSLKITNEIEKNLNDKKLVKLLEKVLK